MANTGDAFDMSILGAGTLSVMIGLATTSALLFLASRRFEEKQACEVVDL